MGKLLTLITCSVLVFGACAHRGADFRRVELFGMNFSAEYRQNVPYRGSVPHQGASDYFFVIDYVDGHPSKRRHYYIRDGQPEMMFEDNPTNKAHKAGASIDSATGNEVKRLSLDLQMPEGATVSLTEQANDLMLSVTTAAVTQEDILTHLGLQAWVLKNDGTSLQQKGQPSCVIISNGFGQNVRVTHSLPKTLETDLAAVVLQMKGKLYCGELRNPK